MAQSAGQKHKLINPKKSRLYMTVLLAWLKEREEA
jgi:hypothetical protein